MKAIFILEGKLNENDQYQISKDIEQLAKDWGLSSYLDDVLEDDICEHNNTITNECSDCNEQELFDNILEHTLTGIMDSLTDTHNVVPDIIDDYQKHGGMQTDDIKIKVEQEVYRRLNTLAKEL